MEENINDNNDAGIEQQGSQGESEIAASLNAGKKENGNKKKSLKSKISEKKEEVASKARMATDKFLKNSIIYFFATWTLSFFYAYVHVFLHGQFPKLFSAPGQEWAPDQIKRTNAELAKKTGQRIGIGENALLGCGCLFHIFIIIGLIAIVYYMEHFWEELAKTVFNWVTSIFK